MEIKVKQPEIKSLKCQEIPVRVVPEISSRSKPPSFDGNTSFSIFKCQFETVASRNMWNSEDKAAELIIETVLICSRPIYDEVMAALQRKYGGEHKQQTAWSYESDNRNRVKQYKISR